MNEDDKKEMLKNNEKKVNKYYEKDAPLMDRMKEVIIILNEASKEQHDIIKQIAKTDKEKILLPALIGQMQTMLILDITENIDEAMELFNKIKTATQEGIKLTDELINKGDL
jgi:hypothetical protein